MPTNHKDVSKFYRFKMQGCLSTLGLIAPDIAVKFPLTSDWRRDDDAKELVFLAESGPTDTVEAFDYRNRILEQYLKELRQRKIFKVLDGWRNELYPIYGPGKRLLLSMERSATPLFGVVSYGVHMTAYVDSPDGIKIWTPKRSSTKQTYPGMMDNSVAGGLSTGEKPSECLVRESMEEASLPESIAKNAKACGIVSYHYLRGSNAGGEVGLSQPEIQYVYDLKLSETDIPSPNDNEAVDFQPLTVDEVKKALADGKFKPNCALVMIDFFIRHGILTPENEPDYVDIIPRLHRKLEFPTV